MIFNASFIQLPRELRDHIYGCVIGDISTGCPEMYLRETLRIRRHHPITECALLYVNQQLRRECIEAFARAFAKDRQALHLCLKETSHEDTHNHGHARVVARDRRRRVVSDNDWVHTDILTQLPYIYIDCSMYPPGAHWGATMAEDIGHLTKQFLASTFERASAMSSFDVRFAIDEGLTVLDEYDLRAFLESCSLLTRHPAAGVIQVDARHTSGSYVPPSLPLWIQKNADTRQWKVAGLASPDRICSRSYPYVEREKLDWVRLHLSWRYESSPTMQGARYHGQRVVT